MGYTSYKCEAFQNFNSSRLMVIVHKFCFQTKHNHIQFTEIPPPNHMTVYFCISIKYKKYKAAATLQT